MSCWLLWYCRADTIPGRLEVDRWRMFMQAAATFQQVGLAMAWVLSFAARRWLRRLQCYARPSTLPHFPGLRSQCSKTSLNMTGSYLALPHQTPALQSCPSGQQRPPQACQHPGTDTDAAARKAAHRSMVAMRARAEVMSTIVAPGTVTTPLASFLMSNLAGLVCTGCSLSLVSQHAGLASHERSSMHMPKQLGQGQACTKHCWHAEKVSNIPHNALRLGLLCAPRCSVLLWTGSC